ncbi:sulfotransferase [Novosphingobium flavum]|uniref:sulfotransferase family protein n=1 Tax=Novosphingobium aerophilum TaxID=2839843 RepID=UPI00163B1C7A|nr:sulfotransferase [Novosphingobium aerophilum]MBC2660196.1 sulfotransferase [Novosphingobium aerophilum]
MTGSAQPAIIRIDDMADPAISPELAAARLGPPHWPDRLTAAEVLDRAMAETGLSDFGPDTGFRERLAVILRALDEDAGLTRGGRITILQGAVRVMANRLRIEDLVKQHPAILGIPIERPIVIAGLPRSGTTHLVNWLSRDDRLHALTLWESEEPVPAVEVAPGEIDPRLARSAAVWGAFGRLLPHMAAMHEMAATDIHEDNELMFMDMNCYNWEFQSRLPRWIDHYLAHDRRVSYAYEKKVLQVITWYRGDRGRDPERMRRRWLLKSPQHMENLAAIKAAFPDATMVITHRDPVDVLRSLTTMLGYSDRIRRDPTDPPGLARHWAGRIERLLRECVAQRDVWGPDQSIDVLFHDYMADQEGMARRIYALAGLDLPPATEAKLRGYLAENPRHAAGKVIYDLEGTFGTDVAALRRQFAFYYDRFPVEQEG